ncbi:protein FAR1-RELATED SEQUENCE 9 isoform X2 [Mercurialis annua]|uniref:protein FAR1-RELATED SEQUENCE 9 isoform X2 n=1 Tax=Mercurialis annua TaxID=3986 RepID=UPI002160770F|nr:protein FAR1-RELATED SEQUENCE 9 isoform X2 [Mercurialis annua]
MSGGRLSSVVEYLKRMQAEDAAFFYALQHDTHQSLANLFWADASSKLNYHYFGDAVLFDPLYRTNPYTIPFAAFTGLNHHGQPILLGCALIFNESHSSFVWLFQTWLHAMSGRLPVSFTTHPDGLIRAAAEQVLPGTRIRFSKHAMFRETQQKIPQIYQLHPMFEVEFKKCINEADTIDEFESSWQTLVQRYYLIDNAWLQSMYDVRQYWVPVYMRNTFFGDLSINEASGELTSFFDGFVDASTTIHMLPKQYEKAAASWQEKELKADYDTTNTTPVLKTPSPMEKQAANLYTRRIFTKFQEELVETLANPATKVDDSGTLTTYRVAKFGEEIKAHTVHFNSFVMKASCSCQMFEYKGIICRHVLAVFRAKNVLTLPTQYVLKRWTRNAKTGTVFDERASQLPCNSQESLSVRYNSLRQEAIKYVEQGAKSIQIYNVAMDALQEASKKVAAMKNRTLGASECGVLTNGSSQMLHVADENTLPASHPADEKEKKIRELSDELESTNQRSEVYRANLVGVLRDMEEQKLKLSVKVQNARLSLKE